LHIKDIADYCGTSVALIEQYYCAKSELDPDAIETREVLEKLPGSRWKRWPPRRDFNPCYRRERPVHGFFPTFQEIKKTALSLQSNFAISLLIGETGDSRGQTGHLKLFPFCSLVRRGIGGRRQFLPPMHLAARIDQLSLEPSLRYPFMLIM